MNGDAHTTDADSAGGAPVPGGETGADEAVGRQQNSAPVPSVGLAKRHHAAMEILQRRGSHYQPTSLEERYAILSAVVWPESKELQDLEAA